MNSSRTDVECRTNEPADAGFDRKITGLRVAYVMSRFPKITETFILREMIELEKLGIDVEVFPLRREKTNLVQPDAQPYVQRAHFSPLISPSLIWANMVTFVRHPIRYLSTLATLIRANIGCRRFLLGAIVFFPKAAYFAARMRKIGIDHVHAHFASHPAAVAFAVGRLSGIPYGFVAHGSDLHRDQHMLMEKTRDAAFVVAISDYNRNMILDVAGVEFADKVYVFHCGIDPQQFSPRSSASPYDQGEGPFRIVCVGTLHEVKGQTYLIQACALLAERNVDFECHFIGGGVDGKALQEQTQQLHLESKISFHGSCTSDEVVRQLRVADVLVAPSVPSRDGRREGIPVVLMEAMASGVPCIASRLSGIPELVEDQETGILTEPGDSVAIANALERIAQERSLRARFAANSIQKVNRHFSLPTNTAQLAEALATTVAGVQS